MRPGCSAEGEQKVSGPPLLLIVTVGAADQEACLALAAVAPAFEQGGEVSGPESFAAFVEDDRYTIGGRRRRDLAAIRKLGHFGRPVDPLQIAVDQIRFGPAADLASCNDVQEHARLAAIEWRGRCRTAWS